MVDNVILQRRIKRRNMNVNICDNPGKSEVHDEVLEKVV